MRIIGTGKHMSAAQLAGVLALTRDASATPVILVGGVDFSALAWDRVRKKVHAIALELGCPEFDGYYGADLGSGEILKPRDPPPAPTVPKPVDPATS